MHLSALLVSTVFLLFTISLPVAIDSQLTQKQKDSLLDYHNAMRRKTAKGNTKDKAGKAQPQAAAMTKMEWNKKVADTAQAWADECPDGHESQKKYGENLAWGWGGRWNWTSLAALWYHEIDDKPGRLLGSVDKFEPKMLGDGIAHYTQFVWAETWQLGCGAKICGSTKTLVCRYYFPGNFYDKPVYKRGKPCSACLKHQKCEDGLCVGRPFECKDAASCNYFVNQQGWCNKGRFQAFVRQQCPKGCKQCTD